MLSDNDTLSEAVEEFINLRINQYGSDEPAVLQETAQCYKECADRLLPTLSAKQERLWNKIESVQSLLDGETEPFCLKQTPVRNNIS